MSVQISAEKGRIYHYGRIKKYPSGAWELLVCNRPIFRESGWEDRAADKQFDPLRRHESAEAAEAAQAAEDAAAAAAEGTEGTEAAEGGEVPANLDRAARRAAGRVRDLALCNDFSWFVTLTLDASKVDRFDTREITRKLNQWLDNQVRRKGLKYVLVAERHKDGAVHFHGMVNDVPGFVPSGTWKVPGHKKPIRPRSQRQAAAWAALGEDAGYHEVFNWDAWPLGFTTAIRLYGTYESAVAYVCKYIRKQTTGPEGGKVGGRWYYSGGALEGPAVQLVDVALGDVPSDYSFTVPEAGLVFGILRGGPAGKSRSPEGARDNETGA